MSLTDTIYNKIKSEGKIKQIFYTYDRNKFLEKL
jgi:hypothetical protein